VSSANPLHVTDPRRSSIRPRDTAAAAASLAVRARTSEFQTLRPVVSLSSWSLPRILLGGLHAHVRDSFSPETAFGLQEAYRPRGSCYTPILTWRPRISGRRSTGMERVTALCHHAVPLFIPATSEDFSVSASTSSITLITVLWSWSACTQQHFNPVVKVVLWSGEGGGAHLTKPGWSKPHTHSNPTNLALFGHKITIYRLNQGDHTIAGGFKWEQGCWAPPPVPLTLITELASYCTRLTRVLSRKAPRTSGTTAYNILTNFSPSSGLVGMIMICKNARQAPRSYS